MVDIAKLQIQIDSSGVTLAGRKLDDLARKGTQVGKTLTTRLTLPLVAGMGAAVREAALLEGAMDKFNVVFRGVNDEMERFINDFNEEFPIARRNAIQAAAGMQDLLVPMGVNRDLAADMTKEWLELAGALSAFNDVPIERALDAIRGGMAGEAEALRRFGIDARAAAVEQVALEEGILAAGQAMTEQVRQQALLIQATRQSTDAIEGLEEQKGSLLWQMEELKRDSQDLLAVWGQDLIPIARDLISTTGDITGIFKEMDEDTRQLAIKAGLLAAALGPATLGLSWSVKILTPLVITLRREFMLLTAAMTANPFMAAATGIVALGSYVQITESQIRSLNRELDNIMSGGADSTDQINKAIADLEDRIERSKRALSSMVEDPEETDTIKRMREQLEQLLIIRDQFALNEFNEVFPPSTIDDIMAANRELTNFVNTDFSNLDGLSEGARKTVGEIRSEISQIEAEIEKSFDPAKIRGFQNEIDDLESTLDRLLGRIEAPDKPIIGMEEPVDKVIDRWKELEDLIDGIDGVVFDKYFPPGSIGAIEQEIASLNEEMRVFTEPETVERYQHKIKDLENELAALRGETEEVNQTARDLGFTFSSAFEDAIVNGNSFRDVLDGIFKDLLRISTRMLVTEPLGNALSGALSGVDFGGGGSSTTVDDALIKSDGSVVKFHPDDNILAMKDFSPVVNGGGSKVNVNVNVVNNTKSEVDIQKRQKSNGDIEIFALVREATKSLHNSGQMDRTMSSNYGITRKGVRRG